MGGTWRGSALKKSWTKKNDVLEFSRVRDSSLIHAGGKGAQEGESHLQWVLEGFRQGLFKKMWWEENTRT